MVTQFSALAQIDQNKLDSLARSIDSSTKAFQAWQDRFIKKQDSLYRVSVKTQYEQNSRNLNNFLSEQKSREKKKRQQAYIRILLGAILLAAVIIGFLRKKKHKT